MKKMFYRIYQWGLRMFSYFLPWRTPALMRGEGCIKRLPAKMQEMNIEKPLIVTDQGIVEAGLLKDLLDGLKKAKIPYAIYDKTVPNPTLQNIEEAYELYKQESCDSIIGFGGGSPIDAAKGVGVRVARPDKPIEKMRGLLKVRKKIPPFIAIPTTAGTGSEGTVAAVVSNPETHEKYAINDLNLIPTLAVLDPLLTLKLPKFLTATTGMDALTHAVEAYLGRSNTTNTIEWSTKAVKNVFKYLEIAYQKPDDIKAREKLLEASYNAGLAFTRAYVGNVHAMAHTFGGFYGVPHGYANAIILPHVLKHYGRKVEVKLAELAHIAGIAKAGDSIPQKSSAFIRAIEKMNKRMNIPSQIDVPNKDHLEEMIQRAFKEANPLYPVPVIFSKKDFEQLYHQVMLVPEDKE